MEKYLVQDLLEICEDLGISAGSAKTKEAILEVMRAENVTIEEAKETWEDICEKKRKFEERERREKWEAEERERREERQAQRRREEHEHALRMKRLDHEIQALKWQRAQCQLKVFETGENIVSFLDRFEQVCEDVGVSQDLLVERLVTLLPRQTACVLECLSVEEAQDFDRAKEALLRHFAAPGPADCSSRDVKALAHEAHRKAQAVDSRRRDQEVKKRRGALQAEARRRVIEKKALRDALEDDARRGAQEAEADREALEAEADREALEAKADREALEAEVRWLEGEVC